MTRNLRVDVISNPLKEWNKGFSWRGCRRSKPPRFVPVIKRIWYQLLWVKAMAKT
jgi:hypothetical protein